MVDIILVNEKDEKIGVVEKLVAHQQGLLHRAFSVFIYRKNNDQVEVLLQKRHPQKYHSANLWTNTCCSHPHPNEDILMAAKRRLKEEMGITAELEEIGVFHYTAAVGNNLIENEIDHVFIGEFNSQNFIVNPEEVSEYKWVEINQLRNNIQQNPEEYTAWLLGALELMSNRK